MKSWHYYWVDATVEGCSVMLCTYRNGERTEHRITLPTDRTTASDTCERLNRIDPSPKA